ncbi:phage tail-collar fiber domain-containing protein [Vibrio harveyi]|uniref:phage tail-collar fiber domain-containing protein n=1 Tax=Vibrio harveyi TaxID=669 RepID=UPI004063E491
MANTTDKSILTAAGKALLAQLNAEEKPLIIDKMIFANVPNRPEFPQPDDVVPTEHVVHQEGVEQRGRLSADSVIYSTTLTSDVGPFEFNWTGAYCSEYGVLVTIDHHALTPKSADEPGVAGNTLVRSVVLEYKDIAEITNITVDASSWQYNATPRMKKMDDDVAQAIIDQNGKDWFIEDGFLVTPQASAFNIKAGAGYVSGNRVTLEFDRNVQVPNKPSFIYVDAHREGTPTGEQVTLFDFVVTAEEKDDYADANGVKHFVCKIAQVLADGSVSDLRPESENKEFIGNVTGQSQSELVGGTIFPQDKRKNARIGDQIVERATHLRIEGTVYPLTEAVIGSIKGINLISKPYTVDVGDKSVFLMDIAHYNKETVNIDAFFAEGNGRLDNGELNPNATDDYAAIQAAIIYAVINGRAKISGRSGKTYKISRKLWVPTTYRAPDFISKQHGEGILIFDFDGAEIIGDEDVTNTDNIFAESAYWDEQGELRSVINTPHEKYLTSGYLVSNLCLTNFYQGFRLKNWVYGCGIKNVHGNNVQQMLFTQRCFYSHWEQIICRGSYTKGLPRFHFNDNNNIMPLKGLVSGPCDIGYKFTGAIEAVRMVDCGIEGFETNGVILDGAYNIKLDSCYIESNQGIGVSGSGTKSITFDNCWGYGDIKMFGDLGVNTNVRIRNNNILGGGAKWFDENDLESYCISDFDLPNQIVKASEVVDVYAAQPAVNVEQSLTVYDPDLGLDSVEGRIKQTSQYHESIVNGSFSKGFRNRNKSIGHNISVSDLFEGKQQVIYKTGITYSDTQCVYLALKVDHLLGTWIFHGHAYGNRVVDAVDRDNELLPEVHIEEGRVIIKSPSFASSGTLGAYAGEIRIK